MNYDKQVAAQLWESCDISVDRFTPSITRHPKSIFLGYADVTIDATRTLPGMTFKVRGVEVNVLKGNPHLNFPSERGNDGKWYPIVFPKSAELRAVLTAAVFAAQQVQAAVEAAKNLPQGEPEQAAATASAENPFA